MPDVPCLCAPGMYCGLHARYTVNGQPSNGTTPPVEPRRAPERRMSMPATSAERKAIPLTTGCLDYFPAALAAVAKLSKLGNDKHNPGQPLHHARGKSTDHPDCIGRHLVDRGIIDPDTGMSHTVEVAWRALALLQEELEAAGAPMARGARQASESVLPYCPVLPDSK